MGHNLSMGEAELDLGLLIKTSQIAVRFSFDKLHQDLNGWHNTKVVSPVYAEAMLESAKALEVATKTLHALVESSTRSIVVTKDV